ncbi:LLM class flavin-dependent oxidoreductase [Nocardioides litoris]|uniref:LLM class flavin-dependent oxidoreductase n=1 Tax=Nocardioides litoris TaxID=1926648 RepID=UPI001123A74C|nr:LLM class flavin-dependent oxidoreductase [Nocardioides litoris]
MAARTGRRPLHLNAFLMGVGHHEAAWRLPGVDPAAALDVHHYVALARTAERGLMDSVFFADSPALVGDVGRRPAGTLDPTLLLAAMALATERIGLVATASTSYDEPWNLARRFASLDHLSGGRAGWNVVTTATLDAARNFGLDALPAHRDRYERAEEVVEVATALWDSWDDDAVLADQAAGVWGDATKVHPPEHVGRHFRVAGPLNLPRSPQGRPVLVQAGSSQDGRAFAARHAEAVFTAQQTLAEAQDFCADVKDRARRLGRDPEHVVVLPGIVPVLGSTEAEARALERELDELIRPEHARDQLARTLRLAPEDLALDRPLPADLPAEDEIEGAKSRYTLIVSLARRERLTVRELIGRLGGGRGHHTVVGTPEQVAGTMLAWADAGAADGFNVMPPVLPAGLEVFVEEVVPLLQARGRFRTAYAGTTLRDHLGLPRPAVDRARGRQERVTA